MSEGIKSLAVIRLLQVKDLSQELLDWLESVDDEDVDGIWNGKMCLPYEQFVKVEELLEVTRIINEQLKEKIVSCEIS